MKLCGKPDAKYKRKDWPGLVCQAHADDWRKRIGQDSVFEMPSRLQGATWHFGRCAANWPLSTQEWRAVYDSPRVRMLRIYYIRGEIDRQLQRLYYHETKTLSPLHWALSEGNKDKPYEEVMKEREYILGLVKNRQKRHEQRLERISAIEALAHDRD